MKIKYIIIPLLFLSSCTRTDIPNTREVASFELAYDPSRVYIFKPDMLQIHLKDAFFPKENQIVISINDKIVFEGRSDSFDFLEYTKSQIEGEINKYKAKSDERLILDLNRISGVVDLMSYKPIVSESEYRSFLKDQLKNLDNP